MDFTYEATGGIEIFGCSTYNAEITYHPIFQIGDILYSKEKAMHGIYEEIAVKKILFPTYLYVDTFNALWNQRELVTYEVATALIEQYILIRNAKATIAAKMCRL